MQTDTGLLSMFNHIQEAIFSQLMLGGLVMFPLLFLSIILVTLIPFYCFTLRNSAIANQKFMSIAERLLDKGNIEALLDLSLNYKESIAIILVETLEYLKKVPDITDQQLHDVMNTTGNQEVSLLNQKVAWLSDIATIAPMLGLLGTVFGMIDAFRVMSHHQVNTATTALAQGVSQALIATATGLIIGIPSMLFFAFFRGRVQNMIAELERITTLFYIRLQKIRYLQKN